MTKKGIKASKGGEKHPAVRPAVEPTPAPAVSPATAAVQLQPNSQENSQEPAREVGPVPGHPHLRPSPPFENGTNSHTGEVHRRGPDRKPRKVFRLAITRALVAAQQHNGGPPISGFEDLSLKYREIMGDASPANRTHVHWLSEMVKETFDEAPDSGSGHITRFIFASEVEAEMKAGGQLHPGERRVPDGASDAPTGAPNPLAGMEELEEPPD